MDGTNPVIRVRVLAMEVGEQGAGIKIRLGVYAGADDALFCHPWPPFDIVLTREAGERIEQGRTYSLDLRPAEAPWPES